MKIAINCIFCQPQGGGIKEYIVNLTNHIAQLDHDNTYILYALEDQLSYARTMLPARFQLKTVPFKSGFFSVIERSLFSQRFWTKEEATERFDLFHSPFFYAPKLKRAKLVVTVHDLRLYRFPRTYNLLRYLYLQYSVKETIRRAHRIISISNFTKEEIVDICKVSPEKITVIHEAVDRQGFSPTLLSGYQLPDEHKHLAEGRFIFSLGHIEPRKNYSRLIEAFRRLRQEERNADVKLVVAGKPNVDANAIIRQMNETDGVVYLNFVPRELLLWLYQHAALFVFPSYYEGFGFPPLEAASLGTLSAVSRASSIPEVCGDCSFYFDPYDVAGMAASIDTALNDEDKRQQKHALLEQQLARFSWERNAKETIALYESMV